MKTLICVVGPTAIGKTAMGIQLAKAFDTEIISADSRQFYREMSIGTAVPTEEELAEVRHHFIHSRSIFEDYSVGDFERDAIELLSDLYTEKDVVVLVGGSGLYVDAVVNGLDDFPKVEAKIREELKQQLEKNGIEALQRELKAIDPETYANIDLQNKQRLIRAIEIYRGTGAPYSSFLRNKQNKRGFRSVYIGLTADREIVYDRINRRVDQMLEQGLLDEAKKLFEHRSLNALQTVGYKELFDWMAGDATFDEAVEEIKKNSRRFAKRQGTWYRKNEQVHWFDYQTNAMEIVEFLKQKKGL